MYLLRFSAPARRAWMAPHQGAPHFGASAAHNYPSWQTGSGFCLSKGLGLGIGFRLRPTSESLTKIMSSVKIPGVLATGCGVGIDLVATCASILGTEPAAWPGASRHPLSALLNPHNRRGQFWPLAASSLVTCIVFAPLCASRKTIWRLDSHITVIRLSELSDC
jgi:hypothetical protein